MSARDPFLRSLLIVVDRLMVFSALSAIVFALLWDVASRQAFGLSRLQPFRALWRVLLGGASPTEATIVALCAGLALTSTTIVSFLLFRRWRRHAVLSGAHLRGPRIEE